ncbi:MAG: diaminopimelate epimerase [Deltaproteobacteria bacterium]|nr:diaminopimelate epimerase [Deltaproteobacteria bacterium]
MGDVHFWKVQGTGNDFVLFESSEVPDAVSDWARRLCHRRLGVGADGLLFVLPAQDDDASIRMRIFNVDGSEAEMCGNGLRCVALHGWARRGLPREFVVQTEAGLKSCFVMEGSEGDSGVVRISMGKPELDRSLIPVQGQGRCVAESMSVEGRSFAVTAVSIGNPHALVFVDSDEDLLELARTFGPAFEHHRDFPMRTNVSFVRASGANQFDAVVWERGCGVTAACGTGACAIGVAACLEDRARPAVPLSIGLPGGTLRVQVAADLSDVMLEGPAEVSFAGFVDPDRLPEPRWMP